jgi:hypothetical protein
LSSLLVHRREGEGLSPSPSSFPIYQQATRQRGAHPLTVVLCCLISQRRGALPSPFSFRLLTRRRGPIPLVVVSSCSQTRGRGAVPLAVVISDLPTGNTMVRGSPSHRRFVLFNIATARGDCDHHHHLTTMHDARPPPPPSRCAAARDHHHNCHNTRPPPPPQHHHHDARPHHLTTTCGYYHQDASGKWESPLGVL